MDFVVAKSLIHYFYILFNDRKIYKKNFDFPKCLNYITIAKYRNDGKSKYLKKFKF